MSIFKKDCPECATPNMVDAVRCDCGYCFDPDALGGTDAAEYADEQDRLYLDYLAARVVQTEAEMIVAREQANADGGNTYKAAAALVAEQALNAMQAEMKQLAARVRSRPARPVAAKPAVRTSTPAPALSAHSRKAELKKSATVAPQRETPRFAAPKPKSSAKRAGLQPDIVPRSEKTTIAKPPAVRHDAVAKPFSTPHVMAKSVEPKPQATRYAAETTLTQQHRAPVAPKSTSVPNSSFRDLQSRRAEAIARAQPVASTPTLDDTLGAPAKRPEPAARSEALVFRPASKATTQDCPSCGATVALAATRCRCGYLFSRATNVPALTPEAPIALARLDQESMQECPNCTATIAAHLTRCNCGYTFSDATEQVPALSLDATALSILTDGIAASRTSRRR
jgi:ribosomal protein S27AE